ncbi:hypothetical protein [Roseobacter sp.]|uniref:hypothetical protein n=1 Tax=Roseobacter sp. TaxID=1907202 RepID=UPI00385E93EC
MVSSYKTDDAPVCAALVSDGSTAGTRCLVNRQLPTLAGAARTPFFTGLVTTIGQVMESPMIVRSAYYLDQNKAAPGQWFNQVPTLLLAIMAEASGVFRSKHLNAGRRNLA